MIKKKVALLFLMLCLGLPSLCYAPVSTNFNVYAESVGFQVYYRLTGVSDWILLEASSGLMNSSSTTLVLTDTGSGYFSFLSNESLTLTLSFSDLPVHLTGDQGNARHRVINGSSHSVVATNQITVSWVIILEPYIPYMFILGMIGLGSMFVGPIVAIKQIKENPRGALSIGITLTALGIGLFLAWLGGG